MFIFTDAKLGITWKPWLNGELTDMYKIFEEDEDWDSDEDWGSDEEEEW